MPWRRHTSAVFSPASVSRKIPMICSSLNRLPFIGPSPLGDELYANSRGFSGGRPTNIRLFPRNFAQRRGRSLCHPYGGQAQQVTGDTTHSTFHKFKRSLRILKHARRDEP